jgi:hypothetical protein
MRKLHQGIDCERDQRTAQKDYRAPMNIPTDWEAVWTAVAMHMIKAPKNTVGLRPIPSAIYSVLPKVTERLVLLAHNEVF